jgi:O-antigen/teichoic acid export membrane protein
MIKNKALLLTILTALVPLVFQVLYLRFISYEVDKKVYGEFIILSSFIYGLSQIFLSIPGQAFSRFYNTVENKTYFINEFRTYLIIINIISIFMVYGLYLIYGDRFDVLIYILIYFLFGVFNNYSFNQKIFLLSLERGKYFILKILEASAKYLFPLFMYYKFRTLESFIVGIVLGYILSFIFLLYYVKGFPFKVEFNLENQKKYFIYAYPIVFSAIFSWSMSFSDRYFIDYFLDIEDVAIYSILTQVSAFGMIIASVYGMYINPIILKKYEKSADMAFIKLKAYLKQYVTILLLAFSCVFIIPIELFEIVIEKKIINSEYYYMTYIILFTSVLFNILQMALSLYFVLLKKLNVLAKMFFIVAVLNIIVNFFIPLFGIIAAAVSTLISYMVLVLLIVIWLRSNEKVNINLKFKRV